MKKGLLMPFSAIQYCMIKAWRDLKTKRRKKHQYGDCNKCLLLHFSPCLMLLCWCSRYQHKWIKILKFNPSNEMLKINWSTWHKRETKKNPSSRWELSPWPLEHCEGDSEFSLSHACVMWITSHFIADLKIHHFYSYVTLTTTSTVMILAVYRTPVT